MNTEHLQYFDLAYRLGSYSAAARRVPCSPQGLSRAVHSLERSLGVTLFDTDTRGNLTPTEYARELHEFAQVLDGNVRLLKEEFDRIRGQRRYTLRLGCSLGVLGLMGPGFLPEFSHANLDVDVVHWEVNDETCDEGLMQGDYDVALGVAPYLPEFDAAEFYRCPMYLWVSSGDPLASRASVGVSDLAGKRVAVPGAGFKHYDILRAEARRAGVELGSVYEISEEFQLYDFALRGEGVGLTVRHVAQMEVFRQMDGVKAIPVEGTPWGCGVQRLKTRALGDAERRFWNWTLRYARRLPSDILD